MVGSHVLCLCVPSFQWLASRVVISRGGTSPSHVIVVAIQDEKMTTQSPFDKCQSGLRLRRAYCECRYGPQLPAGEVITVLPNLLAPTGVVYG